MENYESKKWIITFYVGYASDTNEFSMEFIGLENDIAAFANNVKRDVLTSRTTDARRAKKKFTWKYKSINK